MEKYIHFCPVCRQGQINKVTYIGNGKEMVIYECDECYLFFDEPYNQNVENAIGKTFENMDNNYFIQHGIIEIDEVKDEGAYY